MSSKYTETFDALKADDNTKRGRAECILSPQNDGAVQFEELNGNGAVAVKVRRPLGRRGVALLTAIAVLVCAVAAFIPVGISLFNGGGMLRAMSLLKDTFVDMDGVSAFGVWNAPDSASSSAGISDVSYIHTASYTAKAYTTDENNDVISGEWSDDERYDWESDYDWDPTKANVLIAIDEDGRINEVVYERTNGRGQIRQDKLGNAAAVYVSDGFTYVMYVNDDEWEFWKQINFAQEMRSPSGFHCHHESMQTVVIHNATGKVFALKDLIPQVSELSGATNYTMQVEPFRNDYLYVKPMYGNNIPQWYNVIYDEDLQKIRYELILPAETVNSYSLMNYICAVRRDKYGQQYLLDGNNAYSRISAGIVNLPSYQIYGNSLLISTPNSVMLGSDGRMYAFDEGKLKVFGENFELHPVESGTEVAFEGIANDFGSRKSQVNDGISYRLEGGYLYSMFGEVWEVNGDGSLLARERLVGSFPRFADDGYLLGSEIIAFVDTQLTDDGYASVNGRMVQIRFDSTDGAPDAVITHIIDASEISVHNRRMVVQQNESPYSLTRGNTRYFLLTVQDGTPSVDYFANGYNGGVTGLTKPVMEPLTLS